MCRSSENTSPFATPFVALAGSRGAAHEDMLVAIEREFRAVDTEGLAERLDELALPLLAAGRAPVQEQAMALSGAAWASMPEEGSTPAEWMMSIALETGRATGAVRAGFAVALGRRAGVAAVPVQVSGRWALHICGDAGCATADLGTRSPLEPYAGDGCACAHQLGFVVLTGLAGAWRAVDEPRRTRRASGLRLLLPLDESLQNAVLRELWPFRARP